MPVTLRKLAELSGCSIRTVSRVLKNSGPVSEELKERILALAKESRYTPNMAARNLKNEERRFVGVIGGVSDQEIFLRKFHELEIQLEKRGFYPLLADPGTPEHLNRILRDWSGLVNAVIFPEPPHLLSLRLPELAKCFDFPFISADGPESLTDSDNLTTLRLDRSAGILQGIETLVRTGHRKILRWGTIPTRDAGWDAARKRWPEIEFLTIREPAESEFCEKHGEKVLQSGCDAVFFDTDRGAAGFLRYAARTRLALPEALSVSGFDDEPQSVRLYPALSSVSHPVGALSRAASILASGRMLPPEKRIFPTSFICRESILPRTPVSGTKIKKGSRK